MTIKSYGFSQLYNQYAEKHASFLEKAQTIDHTPPELIYYIMNTGSSANSSQIILSSVFLNCFSSVTFYLIQENNGVMEKLICVYDTKSPPSPPEKDTIEVKVDSTSSQSINIIPHFDAKNTSLVAPVSSNQSEKYKINETIQIPIEGGIDLANDIARIISLFLQFQTISDIDLLWEYKADVGDSKCLCNTYDGLLKLEINYIPATAAPPAPPPTEITIDGYQYKILPPLTAVSTKFNIYIPYGSFATKPDITSGSVTSPALSPSAAANDTKLIPHQIHFSEFPGKLTNISHISSPNSIASSLILQTITSGGVSLALGPTIFKYFTSIQDPQATQGGGSDKIVQIGGAPNEISNLIDQVLNAPTLQQYLTESNIWFEANNKDFDKPIPLHVDKPGKPSKSSIFRKQEKFPVSEKDTTLYQSELQAELDTIKRAGVTGTIDPYKKIFDILKAGAKDTKGMIFKNITAAKPTLLTEALNAFTDATGQAIANAQAAAQATAQSASATAAVPATPPILVTSEFDVTILKENKKENIPLVIEGDSLTP